MGDDLPTVDFGGDGRALSVEAGGGTTCVVLADRTLRCWGANRQGQLGVPVLGEASQAFGDAPNEMGRLTPFPQLGRGRFVAQVSLGDHSCAVFTDGDLKCWGGNTAGELGLGFQGSAGAGRAQMGDALNTVDLGGQAVALLGAGRFSTCALMSDGHTKCWGSNQGGQLGVGDTLGRGARRSDMGGNLPVTDLGQDQLGDPLEPRQVVGGYSHFCALLEGGVKCWGDDSAIAGALGSGVRQALGDEPGEMGGALPFVDLGQGQRVEKIFGANHVCAVMDTGVMKCWGPNYSGQLGYGDTDARGDDPGEMGEALGYVDMGTNEQDEPHRVLQMVGNFVHSCALLDGGHVKCWGDNFAGQLGYGDTEARGDEPGEMGDALPYVDLGGPAIEITDQGYGTCALLEGGLVKCWGYGAGGGLGQGDAENIGDEEGEMGEALPSIDLGSGRTAIRLFPGADTSFHTCAQLDNLQVKCWGAGYAGQLGNGSRDFVGDTPGEMGDALPYLDLGR